METWRCPAESELHNKISVLEGDSISLMAAPLGPMRMFQPESGRSKLMQQVLARAWPGMAVAWERRRSGEPAVSSEG